MLVSSIFGTLSRPYAREYSMIFTSSSVVLKSSRNDRQTTLASIKTKIELACIPWRTKNQFEARKHLIMTRAIVLAMKLAGLSADVEELKIVCGAGVTYSDGVISIASTAIQPRKRNILQHLTDEPRCLLTNKLAVSSDVLGLGGLLLPEEHVQLALG